MYLFNELIDEDINNIYVKKIMCRLQEYIIFKILQLKNLLIVVFLNYQK